MKLHRPGRWPQSTPRPVVVTKEVMTGSRRGRRRLMETDDRTNVLEEWKEGKNLERKRLKKGGNLKEEKEIRKIYK